MDSFISWFHRENGTLDVASMGLADIPGQGRGAVALQDIPEGHTLFTIPRSLTLSTRTSSLPSLLGEREWKRLQLNKGWVGLILCMMWEESRGSDSKWFGYLETLPKAFDTPMFWTEEELKQLEGTALIDKIGKDQAEQDYHEKLIPALQSRPDLFNPTLVSTYSIENYHLMGSRILSRSFLVEKWEGENGEEEDETEAPHRKDTGAHKTSDSMDIDGEHEGSIRPENDHEAGSDGTEDEDEEDPSDVAMVPMADMLNARFGSENAKLFYEPTELKMVTTKPIKAGEQIFNTYGDPPNSDLLRKYGHVDLLPLSEKRAKEGNPADIAEIPADLVIEVLSLTRKDIDAEALKERIDWWLEEGGDDVFDIQTNLELPEALVSFFKVLLLSPPDWEKVQSKSKPPKPKMDLHTQVQILPLAVLLLENRLAKYPTSLEDDESLISSTSSLPHNMRNAIIVRVGEKRILEDCKEKLRLLLAEAENAVRERNLSDKGGKEGSRPTTSYKKRKREIVSDSDEKAGRRGKR